MQWWDVLQERYRCQPNITGSGNTLEAIHGNHMRGKTNADVEFLYVEGQAMNSLPRDIEVFFPKLIGLYILDSGLLTISAEDLRPFPNLLLFGSQENPLESLDGDLFKYTRKLRRVNISNQLQHVGHDLLAGLHNLTNAWFLYNPCISVDAYTKETVEALKLQLPINCPLLTATTVTITSATSTITTTDSPGECPEACSELLYELSEQTENQKQEIDDLKSMFLEIKSRVVELEMQMRELASSPCSPCS